MTKFALSASLTVLWSLLVTPMVLAQHSAPVAERTVVGSQDTVYYPGRGGDWERRRAQDVGMDPLELRRGDRTVQDARRPDRRHWGEPHRVDMTFSVTKSFLSTTVGLAWDRGMIRDIHDPVKGYVPTDHFDSEHNRKITWDHLLRQTSDWEGTLWAKPDWADRPPRDTPLAEYQERERNEPGSSYKYNDVRVNVLALAALHVWRRPLPQVLRDYVMDPIGASNTWRWYGYENSWVNVDGVKVQSVSGGGHWGGGMWISALDQARFGLFTLRRGKWKDQQLLSDAWVTMALTPTEAQPTYGFMNWFLDPEHDIVIVARWIQRSAMDELVKRVLESIEDGG
jgi:CubicO group peptidase (beta-lactamase class C family)